MEILGGVGGLLMLVGWIWIIIIAFQNDGPLWGILNIFLQPFMGIIYFFVKKAGGLQVGLMVIGFLIMLGGVGSSIFSLIG